MRTIRPCLLTLCLCLFWSTGGLAFEHPGGVHTRAQIQKARQELLAGAAPWTAAHARLIDRANAGLSEAPSAVEDYDVPGYYENAAAHTAAKTRLRDDANAAYSCALAFQINFGLSSQARTQYAEKAKAILNDWAYTNKRISGHDGDLVMAYVGTTLALAAELLWDHPGWSETDKRQFRSWTQSVLRGASAIQSRSNNWADWGIFAALVADHLLDDASSMQAHVSRLQSLIDDQIAPDGSLPSELRRGEKSLWYTYFALAPLTNAVELVRNATGTDLYTWTPPSGGTLRQAVAFFFRGASSPAAWPTEVASSPEPDGWGGDLLYAMGLVYEDRSFLDWARPPFGPSNAAWESPDLLLPAPLNSLSLRPPGRPKLVN